jgi:hypothetical protein
MTGYMNTVCRGGKENSQRLEDMLIECVLYLLLLVED